MFEESNTLREKRKHNNILGLNKNYNMRFSFSYNLFILGKKNINQYYK